MALKRRCRHCDTEYTFEGAANLITFCPSCKKYDFLECEYGYGPVVPCVVYLGNKEIAMVNYHDRTTSKYRYDSDYYNVHKVLTKSYLEALEESINITANLLDRNNQVSKGVSIKEKC